MNTRPNSLLRTLLKSMLVPSIVAIIVGGLFLFLTVKEEYDEILDIGLTNKAHLLLNLMEGAQVDGGSGTSQTSTLLSFEESTHDPEERTVFWHVDANGSILHRSPLASGGMYPPKIQEGFTTANGYRFRVLLSQNSPTTSLIVGEPLHERNEAVRDITIGALASFFALVAIMCFATFRSLRLSVRSIGKLSDNIAGKGEHNLTPIDRSQSFLEIEPAVDTLDELMVRLNVALTAEREFATVAAHELRTPVAICLAHIQRLKAALTDAKSTESAASIEQGLKRLTRLIERLLQLSRAQSGLGTNSDTSDLNEVTRLLLSELKDRKLSGKSLQLEMPEGTYASHVNPDAFGIILNNLFDNALKYCDGPDGIIVNAAAAGEISISNDCEPLNATEIEEIKQRFGRKSNLADGYGLGLSIVQTLCEQSKCTLEIGSPMEGSDRGFVATLKFP